MEDPNRTTGYMVMRSVPEAARECGVPETTIRRWVAEGLLSAIEIGGRPMVNGAEVAAIRERLARDAGRRDRLGYGRLHWLRLFGAANVAAALAGLTVFVGVGPDGLRTPWWLGLCVASLVVGLVLWRLGGPAVRWRRGTSAPSAARRLSGR